MTQWKKVAATAEKKAADAERRRGDVILEAMKHKARADALQDFATEAVALMRMLVAASEPRMLPGVYFLLCSAGRIQYVGQSDNVLFRMAGHREKKFARAQMIHVKSASERDRLEARFIHIFEPPLNVQLQLNNRTQELLADGAQSLPQKVCDHSETQSPLCGSNHAL
jgi:hypothetical protein